LPTCVADRTSSRALSGGDIAELDKLLSGAGIESFVIDEVKELLDLKKSVVFI
jgi:hypothetical protein